MKRWLLLSLLLFATLPGCVRAISDETRKLVDPAVTFAALKSDPTPYMGRHIMIGGRIAAVKNSGEGGQLEIVQFDLDDSGLPRVNDRSGGRFLAVSVDFLDGMVYKPGRMITLVGEVKGKKSAPLDELDYTYPVLAIRETHLWRMTEYDQLLFTPAPYYDPYYFDYQQSPYWYRQFAPEQLKRPGVSR